MKDQILKEFKVEKDVHKVAELMGIDPSIVRHHVREAGLPLPKGSYAKAKGSLGSCLSEFHAAVGAKICFLRLEKQCGDPGDFAETIGISTKRYTGIERGQHDATLSDLRRVASGMGMSVVEFFTPLGVK